MAKKFLQRILPNRQELEQHKLLRKLGPWVLHPGVWTLHRRSVAGGVAAGLFCGLLPAPFQMLTAALASFLFHWNLPVAVFATLYTNPITFIPLYLLSLKIGIVILNTLSPSHGQNGEILESAFPAPPDFLWSTPIESFLALGQWVLGMGWPLVVGVFTLASCLAITGYILTRLAWNLWVRREVMLRKKRRG
jgi:uncharacterized protein (DUF2062 family)